MRNKKFKLPITWYERDDSADPKKVNTYRHLALAGKNERIRRKNAKKYWGCFELRMRCVDDGAQVRCVSYYEQTLWLRED